MIQDMTWQHYLQSCTLPWAIKWLNVFVWLVQADRRASSPLLVQFSYPNQKHNQTNLTQKHLQNRALCTIYSVEAQSEEAKGLTHALFFCTTLSTWLYTLRKVRQVFLNGMSTTTVQSTWFKSWVMIWKLGLRLHMTCSTLALGAVESSYCT